METEEPLIQRIEKIDITRCEKLVFHKTRCRHAFLAQYIESERDQLFTVSLGKIRYRPDKPLVGMDVTALDGSARPIHVTHGRMLEEGWEIPVGDVPATTYLIKVIR